MTSTANKRQPPVQILDGRHLTTTEKVLTHHAILAEGKAVKHIGGSVHVAAERNPDELDTWTLTVKPHGRKTKQKHLVRVEGSHALAAESQALKQLLSACTDVCDSANGGREGCNYDFEHSAFEEILESAKAQGAAPVDLIADMSYVFTWITGLPSAKAIVTFDEGAMFVEAFASDEAYEAAVIAAKERIAGAFA